MILTALITVSGLYAAVSGLSEAVESGGAYSGFLFLKLFTVSANSIVRLSILCQLLAAIRFRA